MLQPVENAAHELRADLIFQYEIDGTDALQVRDRETSINQIQIFELRNKEMLRCFQAQEAGPRRAIPS